MKFQETLTNPNWFWGTSFSLAYASKLSYKRPDIVEMITTEVWGFDSCRPFDIGNTQGFVAWNNDVVLVAFRGTDGISDFLLDLTFRPVETPHFEVHQGFWNGFEMVRNELRALIEEARPDGKRVFITGHSLGGALAQIAAAELSDLVSPSGIYTYGQPAVGLENFSDFMDQRFAENSFRFVNKKDIVPRVPPQPYHHTETPLYLDKAGQYQIKSRSARELDEEVFTEEMFDEFKREELRKTLRELEHYAKQEKTAELDRPVQQNRFLGLGLREHAIDVYIERIGKELSSETRNSFLHEGNLRNFFIHLPDQKIEKPGTTREVTELTSSTEAVVSPEDQDPAVEAFEVRAEEQPFSVHVIWSTECNVESQSLPPGRKIDL